MNGIENWCSEQALKELDRDCAQLPKLRCNKFLETRTSLYDKWYSMLYPVYQRYHKHFHYIQFLLSQLAPHFDKAGFALDIRLSEKYRLLDSRRGKLAYQCNLSIEQAGATTDKLWLRKIFYKAHNLLKSPKIEKSTKTHLLFITYDTANDVELYSELFRLLQTKKEYDVSIVQVESGNPVSYSFSAFEGPQFRLYRYKDFKPKSIFRNKQLYDNLPESLRTVVQHSGIIEQSELHYGFLDHLITQLAPSAIFYNNTGEIGKFASDVGRFHNIPVVNVEYAMFSDDFVYMATRIDYTARFCLGEESVKIWKNKHDQSRSYFPVGFLKMDAETELENKSSFLRSLGMDPEVNTLFFASTSANDTTIYGREKSEICREIAELCIKQHWQLLVKLHPSEFDHGIRDIIAKLDHPSVRLLEHKAGLTTQILSACSAAITQNSSVGLEAALQHVPTIFYNKTRNDRVESLIPMKNEPFVHIVDNMNDLCAALERKTEPEIFDEAIARYMVADDRKASHRFIEAAELVMKSFAAC